VRAGVGPSGIVTLTTDFGTADGYAGAMKGVILARCPHARLVDLSHELAPGDLAGASHLLGRATPFFPAGTVHLAVVDPGVGTSRRGLALQAGEQLYVGPDNGIFSDVLGLGGTVQAFALENADLWRSALSPVFHGRDVFAPIAAHLASGGALPAVGPTLRAESLIRLHVPAPRRVSEGLRGRVAHVDRFGNLVTNLRHPDGVEAVVEVAGRALRLARTYGDVAPGELVAVVGSSGFVEIAVNGGSAAAHFSGSANLVVTLRPPRESA
jgi:S-adenosyl-L-methionine hydrolase (adenosine-forming)